MYITFYNSADHELNEKLGNVVTDSIVLVFENKKLQIALTRGSGVEGEIVTESAKLISNMPKEIDYNEVKDNLIEKVQNLQAELADLDKEKVLKIAKKKAKEVQKKAEELVDYAVAKGTPILERTADAIREKAVVVTKDVLAKLEKDEEK